MKYTLGNKEFKNKDAIKKYFQEYHNKYSIGTILNGEYKDVMIDLVKWHPNYDDWNINGPVEFKIHYDCFGNKNYRMMSNGEWNDESFSYIKCIRKPTKENNHRRNVISASRNAIMSQIEEYRNSQCTQQGYLCEICNTYVYKEDIHIDHNFDKLTFQQILDDFLKENGKTYNDLKVMSKNTLQQFDNSDREEWSKYHQSRAMLRCLCIKCHYHK